MRDYISPKKIPANVIRLFLKDVYGLTTTDKLKAFKQGIESAVWFVVTDDGKFIIKIFPKHEGPEEKVKNEAELYHYLIGKGIRCPQILQSKNIHEVEKFTYKNYQYPVIVMRFEEARTVYPQSVTKNELTEITKTIARMHKFLQVYPDKNSLKNKINIWKKPISMALEIISKSTNLPIFNSTDSLNTKIYTQAVQFVNDHPVDGSDLTQSVIHGDIALEHIRFLTNGAVYIFDFSDRSWAPIADEIAIMLVHFFREQDISFKRWENLKEWLLEAYISEFPLSEYDISAIKPLMLRRIIREIRYLSKYSKKLNRNVDAEGIKRRYKLADYLLINYLNTPIT